MLGAFVFVLMPFAIHAQDANAFIGSWRVNVTETLGGMEDKAKARYDSLPMEERNRIIELLTAAKVTFNLDKTVISISGSGENILTSQGKWRIDEVASVLVLDIDGRVRRFKYKFMSPLVLRLDFSDEKSWFNLVYLTKD